jgi:hypothetical protein
MRSFEELELLKLYPKRKVIGVSSAETIRT